MPSFNIIRKSCPKKTFRVCSVLGTYDLQNEHIEEHFVGNIDFPDKWQIGLIVGNSGTGKTTIARELFPQAYIEHFEYKEECFLDDFPEQIPFGDICKVLTSVGLGSVPTWLKPYSVLSNGEKMRVDLARALLQNEDLFVFDEYTSVVDRNIAKVGAFATQKAIRRSEKKFIAVSCHFDIEDWLLPDWVFDTNTMTFRKGEGQKKNINIDIYKIDGKYKKQWWALFRKYHYLSDNFNPSADTFVAFIDGKPAAFTSALHFVHPKVKKTYRGHRTVVLPDFQGIGIGMKLREYIASYYKKMGFSYITTTSSPNLIYASVKSPNWAITRKNRCRSGSGSIQNKYDKNSTSCERITCGLKYIGK